MAWRNAKSILKLRDQINAAAPRRDKSADGTIGDAAHASRSSDHNPWVKDGGQGVVRAIDITHDLDDGVDAGAIAEAIRASGDQRVDYIISNNRIANSGKPWRKYDGKNPHTMHFHVSVDTSKALYDDTRDWQIGMIKAPLMTRAIAAVKNVVAPKPLKYPTLKRGSRGADVRKLQALLKIAVDGQFGPKTEAAVMAAQKAHQLVADGYVGPYTWKALGA
jgi:murein L,D-transpeptidase YcbB/YkuD